MNIKYILELTEEERVCLLELTSKGKGKARMIKRANILLMADRRQNDEEQIAELLSVGSSTIYRTKRDFVEEELEAALEKENVWDSPENWMQTEKLYLFLLPAPNHQKAVVNGHYHY